nr:hypothetical protein [Amycolatopsis coloradensis]
MIAKAVSKAKAWGLVLSTNVDAGGIFVKLVYYFILLIALQFASGVFGESNPVSALLDDIIAFLPRILVALVLVIVAGSGGGLIKPAQERRQGWPANSQGRLEPGGGNQKVRSEPPTSPVGIGRVDS